MAREVTIRDRVRVAFDCHTRAYENRETCRKQGDWVMTAFWNAIAQCCLAEIEECSAALTAGLEAIAPIPGLLSGNADIHPQES